MKNKTLLSYLNQAAFISESESHLSVDKCPVAAFISESKNALFRPALLSYLNTFIYLAIGKGFQTKGRYKLKQHARQSRGKINDH